MKRVLPDTPVESKAVKSFLKLLGLLAFACVLVCGHARAATNRITGHLKNSSNNPIPGVDVRASATLGGTNYQTSPARTDSAGFYSLAVTNGSWTVSVDCNNGSNALPAKGYCCVNDRTVDISGNDSGADFVAATTGQVVITTLSPLPAGAASDLYQFTLESTSCQPPFDWSLTPGSPALPAGLTLFEGMIFGLPETAGSNYFSVRVTDNVGRTANKVFSLIITAEALEIATLFLPDGSTGVFYSVALAASGGQPPYKWSLAPFSEASPGGLGLSTNGILSGTPTYGGTYFFSVRVTDANLTTADSLMALSVASPGITKCGLSAPVWLTNRFQARLNGVTGQNYTVQYSTSLTNWNQLLITNSGSNSSVLITDPAATNKQRSYRVLVGP